MKKLFLFMFAAMVMAACGNKSPNGSDADESSVSVENLVEVTFNVDGMTCEGCENAIMKSIETLDGIAEVSSSFEEGWTKVAYDKSAVQTDAIEQKIADAGYTVTGVKN